MRLFNRKSPHKGLTRTEALAGIPERAPSVSWKVLESGDILIEYPLQLQPFFLQLANRFHKGITQRPTKKLQLDGMGSTVWQMFDGARDVRRIIADVAEQSGLSLLEAEISVTAFLRQLGRRGLILIR
ncbi:PqqD family protein [Desulfopila sp. IMCC35006]|uniref:PqqD family protein n=1 Tax=Desulfopila sp. IMCC35006 TaxID=2569542 RepID=UPI0010ACBA84|nr:PqqD family protein [Desulfopila sp. IMCC35006]TKB23814.1 PqqD family protein [Desulfopila sp. IMCC35006]